MNRRSFETYHPIVLIVYFVSVITMGVLMLHPVLLVMGIIAAFTDVLLLRGTRAALSALAVLLPVTLVTMAVNILTNHRGSTILMYTEYSYLTLEAAVYGAIMGGLIGLILMWFAAFNKVMTSDKIIYLLGRIIPANSLIFSMVMRFVPNYKRQIDKIANAQRCMGMSGEGNRITERARYGIRLISVMFSWALESSIDTADSMKSRGYGIPGRTSYSIYRWDVRDVGALIYVILGVLIVAYGASQGVCHAEFYPEIVLADVSDFKTIITYAAYGMLCLMPVISEGREALRWKRSE